MKTFDYIISKVKGPKSTDLIDVKLSLSKVNASSHYWNAFLITCVESTQVELCEDLLDEMRGISIVRTCQGLSEAHEFVRNYHIDADLKLAAQQNKSAANRIFVNLFSK